MNYNNAFSYYVGWRTAQQASLLLTEIDQTVHWLTALGWRPTQNRKLLDKQIGTILGTIITCFINWNSQTRISNKVGGGYMND